MIHTFAISIFFLIFLKYLSREFKKKVSFKDNLGWLAGVLMTTFLASVFAFYNPTTLGNFVLHTVGGGVAVGIAFFYLKRQLKFDYNWRIEFMLLLALVSITGNLNEIAEFAFESAGVGIFSFDTHDTWRDIVANTLGAGASFILIKFFSTKRS